MFGPTCGTFPPTLIQYPMPRQVKSCKSLVSFEKDPYERIPPTVKLSQNIGDYLKFNDSKAPYFQGSNLVVPGASIKIPDFEKKYEDKYKDFTSRLSNALEKRDIKSNEKLMLFVYIFFGLEIVVFIVYLLWMAYKAFS